MTPLEFQDIFFRLQEGKATREQMDLFLEALEKQAELERWFQQLLKAHFERPDNLGPAAGLPRDPAAAGHKALDQLLAHTWEVIDQRTRDAGAVPVCRPNPNPDRRRTIPVIKWAAAAAILAAVGLGTGLYLKNRGGHSPAQSSTPVLTARQPGPILPGKPAALLTVAGGRQIALDSAGVEDIKNGGRLIAYNKAGRIDYQTGTDVPDKIQYNTLTTEKGNRYQLILPDGTKAWLNAESSIRFPSRFANKQRTVSVTGEVYFEVHHDNNRPFIVQVKGQTIRDIGTAFNINAYEDEPSIKTTLIEGVIQVNDTRLKPGWQADILPDGKMTIDKNADLAEVISWKNNAFVFHQTDMGAILRQVARWYDVRIVYKGSFDQTFTGGISRQSSLEEVLKILSFSNKIKFEVHDRNIIVRPL